MSELAGIPIGLKAVAFDFALTDAWYICARTEAIIQVTEPRTFNRVLIVEKDNVYDIWRLDQVAIPDGYARDDRGGANWFRNASIGNTIVDMGSRPHVVTSRDIAVWSDRRRIIIYQLAKAPKQVVKKEATYEYEIVLKTKVHLAAIMAKSLGISAADFNSYDGVRLAVLTQIISKKASLVSIVEVEDIFEDDDEG